jgi:hypothetical protein
VLIDKTENNMRSVEASDDENTNNVFKVLRSTKFIIPTLGIGIVIAVIILALSIATLVKVNKQYEEIPVDDKRAKISSKILQLSSDSGLASSIRIEEVMSHLNELQRIATASNGTRAINTPGFNATLDFISNFLTANTNYKVTKSFFFVRDFALASNPILISSINGVTKNYTYSKDISTAEFYHVKYSTSVTLLNNVELTAIPNDGCSEADWEKANPSPRGRVALVKRGTCVFRDKAALAAKYNVAAILLYNDGTSPDRVPPIEVSLAQDNNIPALFVSFTVGQALVNAAQNRSQNASVRLVIDAKNLPNFPVGNICADTPTGNATQTIVIGSHSDSVTEGAGINDNGKFTISITFLVLSPSPLRYRQW